MGIAITEWLTTCPGPGGEQSVGVGCVTFTDTILLGTSPNVSLSDP